MQDSNKRIAKNTLFLYIRTFIVMIISLYTSRVVLDILGESDFGIYNLVGGIVVLFSFMTNAMSTATQRYLSYELGKNDINEAHKIFSMSLTIHIFIAIIIFLLGESLGLWFVTTHLNIPEDRYAAACWVYQFSLFGCCASILRIPYNASVIAYEKMSFYAYISIADAILRLFMAIILIRVGTDKLIFYAFQIFVVIAVLNYLYYYYCKNKFSICIYQYHWDKPLFCKMVSFSGWSMTGSLANVGANQGINILLNIFYGVTINAALGIANQVQGAVLAFVSSFQTAFSPQIIKNYTLEDKTDFYKLICRSSRLSYCLIFVVAPAFMVCLDPILNLWLTIIPQYTNPFIKIFVIYMMIDAMSGPLWVSVQAKGDIKRYQLLMSAIIVANIPIMLILLFLGGNPIIVVSVRAILNFITHLVRIEYLRRYLDFPSYYYWKDVMLRCFLLTIVSVPIYFYFIDVANKGLIMAIVAMGLVMLLNAILVALLGVSASERNMILRYIRGGF